MQESIKPQVQGAAVGTAEEFVSQLHLHAGDREPGGVKRFGFAAPLDWRAYLCRRACSRVKLKARAINKNSTFTPGSPRR
jgi:hypothetical protein